MKVKQKGMGDMYIKDFQGIQAASGDWYTIVSYIGGGGNGWTYQVMCTSGKNKGNLFALKVLYNISSKVRIERFLKEVKWMQSNHYPSILQHYDSGIYKNHPFVVMEHMPTTLAKEVIQGRVSFGQALMYSQQLIAAVMHLHANKYFHRDIKPENIFIKGSSAILGDFGLIKQIDSVDKDVDEVKGYIAMPFYYRTPDLVEYAKSGADVDFRSDIFQLGLVLAFMFNGKNPLKPVKHILDPVELNTINIPKGKYGRRVYYVLNQMLQVDKNKRMTLDLALDHFYSIFELYVKDKKVLDNELDF